MELKKSPKADLENKKSYFFEIGLIISLAVIIGLFSWSQSERVIEMVEQEVVVVETEMVEVTIQDDKRPPAPVKTQAVTISEILNVVKNDAKIEQTLNILDLDVTQELAVDVSKFGGTYTGEGEVDEDIPVLVAESMPKFNGGDQNVFSRTYVFNNLEYPPTAVDNGSEGTVTVSFVVERDGSVTNVKVMKGVDRFLDAEAIRVVSRSPKWTPGSNRGKPVRVQIILPVVFRLE